MIGVQNISLLWFGRLSALAVEVGTVWQIEGHGCELEALLAELAESTPQLRQVMASEHFKIAINDTLVDRSAWVHPGDRVAMLPPVTGG